VSYRILSSGLASRVGLRHEQIHFDLAEVYTRKARKFFRELRDPCPRSDDDLNGMAERIFREHSVAQRRYDTDTRNGELELKQIEWERMVARDLVSLGGQSPFPQIGGCSVPEMCRASN